MNREMKEINIFAEVRRSTQPSNNTKGRRDASPKAANDQWRESASALHPSARFPSLAWAAQDVYLQLCQGYRVSCDLIQDAITIAARLNVDRIHGI